MSIENKQVESNKSSKMSANTLLKIIAIFIIAEIVCCLGSLTIYSNLIFKIALAGGVSSAMIVYDLSLTDSFFKELIRRIKVLLSKHKQKY